MQSGHIMLVLLWSGSGSMSSNLFVFIISQQVMNEGVNWEWLFSWFTASLRVTKHSQDFEVNGQFLDWQMAVRECIITITVITLWCDDIGHKDLTYKTTTRNIFAGAKHVLLSLLVIQITVFLPVFLIWDCSFLFPPTDDWFKRPGALRRLCMTS